MPGFRINPAPRQCGSTPAGDGEAQRGGGNAEEPSRQRLPKEETTWHGSIIPWGTRHSRPSRSSEQRPPTARSQCCASSNRLQCEDPAHSES
jgi:hypothetical protein